MTVSIAPLLKGRVSADGRLTAADPELLALQQAAGGTSDGPFVIPALAHLVRVARRIGMTIARPVTIASPDRDLAFWARIRPDGDEVSVQLLPQALLPAVPADQIDHGGLAAIAAMRGAGWSWTVDRTLRFVTASAGEGDAGHELPRPGTLLSGYFLILERTDHEPSDPLPMLTAVAQARAFAGQPVMLRSDDRHRYLLAGVPLFDVRGRLNGYRGKALLDGASSTAPVADAADLSPPVWHALGEESYSPAFSRRLDLALRQPLGRIVANANTISGQMQGPLRGEYAAYAADIAAAGKHLLALIDDLGDLQAIERPDFRAERELIDLADLARRAAGLLKVRAAERGVTVSTPSAGERIAATAEYRRVLQILVNLIGNAVRHSPSGGQVWVRVDDNPAEGIACVVVADQGQGIDPADHERIFERFERLNPDDPEGTGLGLYISRRLARAMAGDIAVESALGQGARFTLTLPIAPDAGQR